MTGVNVALDACICVACGGSGSGKSAWIKQQVRKYRRAVVWDISDEYSAAGFHRVQGLPGLARALLKAGAGPGRYAYVPAGPDDFEGFCRAAFAWRRCAVIVEELANVTTPGKAPWGWHRIVSMGRKYGLHVYAATQRPAESDKTVIGNATLLHVGRMTRATDRAYMARELDIDRAMLDVLKPLEFVEKDMAKGRVTRGKMKFSAKKSRNS